MMAMNAKTTKPICPDGMRSPHEENDKPSTGMCEIISIQLSGTIVTIILFRRVE